MSKLAHSDEKTMDELDRQRAVENGDEDLLKESAPLHRIKETSNEHGRDY